MSLNKWSLLFAAEFLRQHGLQQCSREPGHSDLEFLFSNYLIHSCSSGNLGLTSSIRVLIACKNKYIPAQISIDIFDRHSCIHVRTRIVVCKTTFRKILYLLVFCNGLVSGLFQVPDLHAQGFNIGRLPRTVCLRTVRTARQKKINNLCALHK